jgi:hypothetical protein
MINAKDELIEFIDDVPSLVIAAVVRYHHNGDDENTPNVEALYGKDHSWQEFQRKMNFTYDNGFGSQKLFGVIWFEDGTYADRSEYDGAEEWLHRFPPEIPPELL